MSEQTTAGAARISTGATIPSPPGLPLVGNLLQVPRGQFTQHLMRVSRDYPGIFAFDFAGFRHPFVTSAALVAELSDQKRFRKVIGPPLSGLRELAGDGLFTAHGDEPNWGKAHRILMPAFGQRAMRGYFDAMLEVAQALADKWQSLEGQDLDVADDMTRLTLETISLCGFGYRFGVFERPQLHPFLQSMNSALGEAMARLTRLPFQNRLMPRRRARYEADVASMHALVDEVIRERRARPVDGRDLMALMLDAVDPVTGERLDDRNLRFQVITFLIAGHETTSGLLSFALYLLMRHPQVLAQCYVEVDRQLGERQPTWDDLAALPAIERVLKEALRLWPTAPAWVVAPFEATLLGGRWPIARDQRVTVLLPALHRDPDVWTDPERFDIDRFLPDNERAIPAHAYKPFGNGQRACIGRQFAMTEARLALAVILQRFALTEPEGYRLSVKETLTLKPEAFALRVRRRRASERLASAAAGG